MFNSSDRMDCIYCIMLVCERLFGGIRGETHDANANFSAKFISFILLNIKIVVFTTVSSVCTALTHF